MVIVLSEFHSIGDIDRVNGRSGGSGGVISSYEGWKNLMQGISFMGVVYGSDGGGSVSVVGVVGVLSSKLVMVR